MQFDVTFLPLVATFLIAGALSFYVIAKGHVIYTKTLSLFLGFVALHALSQFLRLSSVDLETKLLMAKFRGTCSLIFPVCWYFFSLQFSGKAAKLGLGRILLLSAIPILTGLVVWTSPWHGLYWPGPAHTLSNDPYLMRLEVGPWYWIDLGYIYLLALMGSAHIAVFTMKTYTRYKVQGLLIILSILAPFAFSVLYVVKATPALSKVDYTSAGFAITGLVLVWAIFKGRLHDLAPIARNLVVDGLDDAMVVLDRQNRVVDLNPAAAVLFGKTGEDMIGSFFEGLYGDSDGVAVDGRQPAAGTSEVGGLVNGQQRHYRLSVSELGAGAKELLGKVLLYHDISEIKRLISDREEAYEQIRRMSITDPLTKTFNRRYLDDNLKLDIKRAARLSRPLTVIICDIDKFKLVNDTVGHQAGDQVLVVFAAALNDSVREAVDWVARYGGEEFVIVLPDMEPRQGRDIAERLRRCISARPIRVGQASITITACFGVYGFSAGQVEPDFSADKLLRRADALLYQAKQGGRNRVEFGQVGHEGEKTGA